MSEYGGQSGTGKLCMTSSKRVSKMNSERKCKPLTLHTSMCAMFCGRRAQPRQPSHEWRYCDERPRTAGVDSEAR